MHKEPVLSTPQCYAEYRSATSHLIISATRHAAARSLGRQSPVFPCSQRIQRNKCFIGDILQCDTISSSVFSHLQIHIDHSSSSGAVQAAPTTAPPQIPRLPTFCFPLYLKACPYVRTTEFLRQYLLSFYKFRQNNHNILII